MLTVEVYFNSRAPSATGVLGPYLDLISLEGSEDHDRPLDGEI